MRSLRIHFLLLAATLTGCAGTPATTPVPARSDVLDPSEPVPLVRLKVHVHGVVDPDGTMNVGLYGDKDSWLTEEGVMFGKVEPVGAKGEVVTVIIEDVPAGQYAVSLYQDEDESKSLKRSSLGIPEEPWGMSNDATGLLGPPSFESAAITVAPPETEVDINLRTGLGARMTTDS